MARAARGVDLPAQVERGQLVLGYRGRDEVVRRTRLRFWPAPDALDAGAARYDLRLLPREELTLHVMIACERESEELAAAAFDDARLQLEADLQRYSAWSCHLRSSNARVDAWVNRAVADLYMLTTELDTGPYPYAGVPWFNTPFGRDGLVTALECLWLRPALARGVLAYLAANQASDLVPEEDAEPGKILHETRRGEMAACNEMPFRRYYGSVDATPLFVVLAGAYWRRTGELAFIRELWPHLERALAWIDEHGDKDGDGFVEYRRARPTGLLHQGWKDSDDAVFHADGRAALGPIALCEVQGYVYAARREAAAIATTLGYDARAAQLAVAAHELRERFARAFWSDELGSYVYALDGDKAQCRVRTSNAGHCLFTGIAADEHAEPVMHALLGPASFCGWGVRTLAAGEARFNPMGYHTGAVWPHDNAIVAAGFARYGMTEAATRIWDGLFEASCGLDLQRLPELFCGFAQQPGEGPVPYPVACAPQAWAAGAVFMTLQACLGLEVDGIEQHVRFTRPQLPSSLSELRIHNLQVGNATVDLQLVRHEEDVGVHVLRREGTVGVTVSK